jgi:ABC-type uncharacterized transport system permease subunit
VAVEAGIEPIVEEQAIRWFQRARALGTSLAAVAVALLAGAVLLLLTGSKPTSAYAAMVSGAIGSRFALGQLLTQMVPLLVIGLGLAMAFRGRVYNIGAEGQFLMGALGGTAVALALPLSSPVLMMSLVLLAGMATGAAYGGIVGVLRGRWGVNEVITSLLLNYVAAFAVEYSYRRPLRDPSGLLPESRPLPASATFPTLHGLGIDVHIGILIALGLVPLVSYLLNRTPFGFHVGMLGLNAEAARVAGVNTSRMIEVLMLASGGLAGLAGIVQIMGVQGKLQEGISPGYGFTAIVVTLIGRNRAGGVLLAAAFMAALSTGGQSMQVTQGVPFGVVLTIQALFVVFLLIADRMARR